MVGLGLSLSLFLFFCMAVLACLAWGISDADVGSAGMGDDCLWYDLRGPIREGPGLWIRVGKGNGPFLLLG